MTKTPKRPRDLNQFAKFMVDLAMGEATETDPDAGKDPAANLHSYKERLRLFQVHTSPAG